MAEHCVCGNRLRELPFKMTSRPCACEAPASSVRVGGRVEFGIGTWVSEGQYNERRAAGLPLETPLEKSIRSREV